DDAALRLRVEVVEVVARRDLGGPLALQGADEVLGRDLDVLVRRPVRYSVLDGEDPGETVRGDLRIGRSQVGDQVRGVGVIRVVAQERPGQTAPVEGPGNRVILLLRVEPGGHIRKQRRLERTSRGDVLRPRCTGRRAPGRTASVVIAATSCRDEREYPHEGKHLQISPHTTPLSSLHARTPSPGVSGRVLLPVPGSALLCP